MQNFNSHDENRAHLAEMHRNAERQNHNSAQKPKRERISLFSRVWQLIKRIRPVKPAETDAETDETTAANRTRFA